MNYDFSMTQAQRLEVAAELRSGTLLPPVITPEMESDLHASLVTELSVPTRSGPSRVLRVDPNRSADDGAPRPLFINFHGGGFVRPYHLRDTVFCAQVAQALGCLVLDVDYRLAPEHPFPIGLCECYDVVAWAFEHAAELGVDAQRIAIGGHSAGGNFSAVISNLANQSGQFKLVGQVLDYPFLDGLTPVREKLDPRSVMPAWRMDAFNVLYAQDEKNLSDPRLSPLLAPDEVLVGLPPTLMLIAGMDPLRFEAQRYAARLVDAGVDVDVRQFPENDHGFVVSGLPGHKEARREIFDWLKRRFTPTT